MSDIVRRCEATTSSGNPCKNIPKRGDKWCAFHQKKFSSSVTHGRYASPELTGLSGKELLTFQEFLEQEDPYNLDHEVAMLRTLLLEQRQAIQRQSVANLDTAEQQYREIVAEDLGVEGVPEEHLSFLVDTCSKRFREIVEDTYGETILIGPSQLSVLVDTVESIAKTAERAKKIADGIVVNVSYRGVSDAVMKINAYLQQALSDVDAKVAFVKSIEELDLEEDEDDWIEGELL